VPDERERHQELNVPFHLAFTFRDLGARLIWASAFGVGLL
jgi:hypothetical protein